VQARLQPLPTVWLMANRQRPLWGDQVMPDNMMIGETAAQYLLRRGHRRVAYLCSGTDAWWMSMRSLSFVGAAADVGAEAIVLKAAEDRSGDLWRADGLMSAARHLVEQLVALSPAPTAAFVAEDRLLPAIHALLGSPEFRTPPARQLEIISCNNERPHLVRSDGAVTIDLRPESIGRRGVELLLWRMRERDSAASTTTAAADRVRVMVEPLLLQPKADALAAAPPPACPAGSAISDCA
jgi:DNA-binding LacI/PurR family transcriptional regulator